MDKFKAIVVQETEGGLSFPLETVTLDALSAGEVLIRVAYTCVNFKDSLAVIPKGGVIRNYPMIPGIDLSGTVVSSEDARFTPGQEVLVTGFKVGMSHTGGFAEYARIPADWVVPMPAGLDLRSAMVIGTAGFTAALSVTALEWAGLDAAKNPSILVTGASGGVGSVATQILAASGHKNIYAMTRTQEETEKIRDLGANHFVMAGELIPEKSKPLEKGRFDFILDTVGGHVAAAVLAQLNYGGSMSVCGNAAGIAFEATVLPFILRGVNLLGIDSVEMPMEGRLPVWKRLATDWNITGKAIVNETNLEGIPAVVAALQKGTHVGRTIVKVSG